MACVGDRCPLKTLVNPPSSTRAAVNPSVMSQLQLHSTLEALRLHRRTIDLKAPAQRATELFEQLPTLPGLILTQTNCYVGMLSRRQFFEWMAQTLDFLERIGVDYAQGAYIGQSRPLARRDGE